MKFLVMYICLSSINNGQSNLAVTKSYLQQPFSLYANCNPTSAKYVKIFPLLHLMNDAFGATIHLPKYDEVEAHNCATK